MSDLILLHQEMLPFILNALKLVEVPCLSLMNPSHPINVTMLSLIKRLNLNSSLNIEKPN